MVNINADRYRQIEQNLQQFQNEFESVLALHNKGKLGVKIIAVTKGFPASDIEILAELGISEIGESKDQEIKNKLPTINRLNINLHFIGQLQRNKAKSVASYSEVIHSIDRKSLIDEIVKVAAVNKNLAILLQVDLAKTLDTKRGGAEPSDLLHLAEYAVQSGLDLKGLMAVAPLGENAEDAFVRFAEISEELAHRYPQANWRSIGMSADWQIAIKNGATHLRIGSALLGNRA